MSEEKKANRDPREGEALCRFNCGTIVNTKDRGDGAEGHCGMCHPEAIALRTARVAPIHEANQAKTAEETEARNKRWTDRLATDSLRLVTQE